MNAREIEIRQWPEFLSQFSREHRAWLTTVDRVRTGSPPHTEVIDRPLASVVPRAGAQGRASIEVRFQEGSRAHGPIQIDAPVSIRVAETAEGIAQALEIVDEAGECTRIRFRAAPMPEELDGLAPGELPLP